MSTRPPKFRADDSFYAFTVKRPVSILMVVMAVAVFGWVSNQRLALTLMPNMSYPTLTVRTVYPGTAPEEMESVVSRPLEQQLGVIPKLVSISSVSKAGQSDVVLEFQWKTDMDLVSQAVREKIDRLRLPEGAQRPLLLHFDPSLDPILRVGLSGPQSLFELRHMAEQDVKRRLESLTGVAAVQVKGGLEEEFLVAIDESKLSQLRLDITQIGQRLSAGNVNMPGGNLREGQTEYVIRTLNEFKTVEEIGALIVSRSNNSIDIRLRDIATVTRFHKDREVITRVNGRESVEIEIFKEADANIVVVAETVRNALFGTPEQQAYLAREKAGEKSPTAKSSREKRGSTSIFDAKAVTSGKPTDTKRSTADKKKVDKATIEKQRTEAQLEARRLAIAAAQADAERQRAAAQEVITRRAMTNFIGQQLPPGATVELLADQSVFISKSIDEVKSNAIVGAIIAVVVLYIFLRNVGQTLIIGLSIPISIVATFAPMYMADVSLNIISLGGLALGVGMLVDNGIVVLESIFRCREEGDDLLTAVVRGTQEVGMAVGASTLTTVAVFLPIVFVEGVAGQVFGDMALTVVFSLLASLAAALFLIPMLASRKFEAPAAGVRAWSGGYLQFPEPPAGSSPWQQPFRVLGLAFVRFFWAPAIIVAVTLKAAAIVVFLAVWPALWVVSRFAFRGMSTWGPTFTAWAAADCFWKISGERLWPGLLAFSAPATLAGGHTLVWSWLTARRWRWLGLLVLPALAVGALLYARQGVTVPASASSVFGASASALPPLKPFHLAVWHWLAVQPWWWLILLFVPGAVPLVFTLARAALEIVLRFVGTVVLAVVFAVAMILVAIFRASAAVGGTAAGRGLDWFENGYQRLQSAYPRLIAAALRHRVAVLGGSAVAFLLCWFVVMPRLGKELIPQVHQGEFNLDVTLPIGTPLERTAEVSPKSTMPCASSPRSSAPPSPSAPRKAPAPRSTAGEHTARLTVKAPAPASRPRPKPQSHRPHPREFPRPPRRQARGLLPHALQLQEPDRGRDSRPRSRHAQTPQPRGRDAPRRPRCPVSSTSAPPSRAVTRRSRSSTNATASPSYGLNLRSVADLVRNKVQGRTATEFRQEDQLIDIVVRLREQDRLGLEELRASSSIPTAPFRSRSPTSPISPSTKGPPKSAASTSSAPPSSPPTSATPPLATVSRDIVNALDTMEFPAGFSYVLAGQNKEMKTSLNSLLLAFGLALFLVYIVMASQFESLCSRSSSWPPCRWR
jgi:multidrug efflux pump subunit AcrB